MHCTPGDLHSAGSSQTRLHMAGVNAALDVQHSFSEQPQSKPANVSMNQTRPAVVDIIDATADRCDGLLNKFQIK